MREYSGLGIKKLQSSFITHAMGRQTMASEAFLSILTPNNQPPKAVVAPSNIAEKLREHAGIML